MNSFKNYKIINEEVDNQAVKDAEAWLKSKYGEELYTFKHIEGQDMSGEKVKTYDIVVGENTYILHLKKYDSNGDGSTDTVGFDVQPSVTDEEEDEL